MRAISNSVRAISRCTQNHSKKTHRRQRLRPRDEREGEERESERALPHLVFLLLSLLREKRARGRKGGREGGERKNFARVSKRQFYNCPCLTTAIVRRFRGKQAAEAPRRSPAMNCGGRPRVTHWRAHRCSPLVPDLRARIAPRNVHQNESMRGAGPAGRDEQRETREREREGERRA